jgi:hypothetical protein
LRIFFLRLYRHNLFETKYFQNEATNAEFRLISLMAATIHSDQKLLERVCLELVKTERNFILKKGETTVANQRELIEKDYDALISKTIETVAARYQQTPHETHETHHPSTHQENHQLARRTRRKPSPLTD